MTPDRHYWTCERESCPVCDDFKREIQEAEEPYRELTPAQLTVFERQNTQERLHDYE